MKLLCPKCHKSLSSNEVNLEKAIAHCHACNEVFKIADFIRNSEELRRSKKPIHSSVTLTKLYDGTTIEIPAKGWNGHSISYLFISIVWNSIVLISLFSEKSNQNLFLILFVLIGVAMILYTIFLTTGKTTLHYGREFITVTWAFINLNYSKKQESDGLEKITEDVLYTKNYQPVYGIGLFFKNRKKIKFGSNLNEDERKWLIGELYELKTNGKK